ncbi:MAG TPA: transposase [Streptosporangiaceae bacterium]|nr:transposase [Streptosporangiaceae bacterium]
MQAATLTVAPAFGPVASDPVISRLVAALPAEGPRALRAIRRARAAARERAWALAGDRAPGAGLEKEKAASTWKETFGFHPLAAFADHGAGAGGEPLAIVLRPGNAGSNTASEHIEVTRLALAQLPRRQRRALIRTDSGGSTPRLPELARQPRPPHALLHRHDHHRRHRRSHPGSPGPHLGTRL